MNEKFQEMMQTELARLNEQGLSVRIRTLDSEQGPACTIDGKYVVNLAANNYLGIIGRRDVKEAAKRAVDEFGVGSGAVKTIIGNTRLIVEGERKLAEFKDVEDVLMYQGGLTANSGTIPAVVHDGDFIFSDELNHASIIDGCRLSRAKIIPFKHCDVADLEEKLRQYDNEPGTRLVVTDGVFSMDGDIAPLPDIVEVSTKHNAVVMVDDAHGEGVLGDHGRGIVNHFHLEGEVDIEVGTMSKAFGVVGGYAAGTRTLVDYLKNKSRTVLFSSTITPADAGAILKVIDILMESDTLVRQLWDNAEYFKEKMKAFGFDTWRSQTPITPVIIGDGRAAKDLSSRLFEKGVFAQSLAFPTVPQGLARIRCMLCAAHTHDQLDFAAEKFHESAVELGILRG
ncbi:MAG TPA: glycine C-acetyltransferase [Candidatus Cryosericum sp.]|jgi:glycine C-acetyltransferase|nr:glycine C-acetyltransferase [Candidatus Cryosericum sp.]